MNHYLNADRILSEIDDILGVNARPSSRPKRAYDDGDNDVDDGRDERGDRHELKFD
jgi:hypothetical protein